MTTRHCADASTVGRMMNCGGDARTQMRGLLKIVVMGVMRTVTNRQVRRQAPVVMRVHSTDVSCALGHRRQSGRIATLIAMHAVRHSELIAMASRVPGDVVASEDPRAQVTLVESGLDVPVAVAADRRADGEEGDAPGSFQLQQLSWRLERVCRQEVDLPM